VPHTRSIPEVRIPGLNQPLDERENHGGGYSEQEHPIGRLKRSEESPTRGHYQITVTQCGVVDRGVVVSGSKVLKFSAEHEDFSPQSDLNQVRGKRGHLGQHDDWEITPEAPAGMAQSSLTSQEAQSHAHGQCVDKHRT
jgi:hypothetical protein